MNVAVILAGGKGTRVGAKIPKQYLKVQGKPILVYTMERYQKNEEIDAIEIVCAADYVETIWKLAEEYKLDKLRWVTIGGADCQDSMRLGILALRPHLADEDIILIHMSVCPLFTQRMISEAIKLCREKGNAFAAMRNPVVMCKKVNDEWTDQNAPKDDYLALNPPWAFRFGGIYELYMEAFGPDPELCVKDYAATLMFRYGRKAYIYPADDISRLKITTPADLEMFEAYVYYKQQRGEEL